MRNVANAKLPGRAVKAAEKQTQKGRTILTLTVAGDHQSRGARGIPYYQRVELFGKSPRQSATSHPSGRPSPS